MARLPTIEMYYRAFREISKIVHSSTELDEVLELVVWKATEVLGAKGALLRILNLESGTPAHHAAYGLSESFLGSISLNARSLARILKTNRKVIIVANVKNDVGVEDRDAAVKEGIAVQVDMPLRFRERIGGVLRIFFAGPRHFSPTDTDFLGSLAEQCVCAIDKARFIEAQRDRYAKLALQTEKLSALGRLAAGVAHEINNPLAAILLYTSNLYKKSPADGPFKEGLGVIMRETKRCKGIIHDLLEFSRAHEPSKVMCNVNTIIERSLKMLENEFRLRYIDIELKLSATVPDSLMDENQMEQVFVNLLLNAAQAMDQQGKITVESFTDAAGKHILADISDTGPGIPSEILDKIFDPFFSTKNSGSGLGLAVSYGIVQNHWGRLAAENLADGGCRFSLVLPIVHGEPSDDG